MIWSKKPLLDTLNIEKIFLSDSKVFAITVQLVVSLKLQCFFSPRVQ